MKAIFVTAAGALSAAILAAAFGTSTQAAPAAHSQPLAQGLALSAPVEKAVTRAGVAHRSARRTSRRVYRRHHY
jgi:hypothetical protein